MSFETTPSTSGRLCPQCGANIGVFASVKAFLPNLMRCGACRAKIGYVGNYWREYLACSAGFGVAIAGLLWVLVPLALEGAMSLVSFGITYVIISTGLWLVIGSLLSVHLMRTKVLFLRED